MGPPRTAHYILLLTEAILRDPKSGAVAAGLPLQFTGAATLSLQSLTGHTSPVESVRLNTPEELIVAGSQSGSIRVWDLEAAKSRPPSFLFLCVWVPLQAWGVGLPPPGGLGALFPSTEQSEWCHP